MQKLQEKSGLQWLWTNINKRAINSENKRWMERGVSPRWALSSGLCWSSHQTSSAPSGSQSGTESETSICRRSSLGCQFENGGGSRVPSYRRGPGGSDTSSSSLLLSEEEEEEKRWIRRLQRWKPSSWSALPSGRRCCARCSPAVRWDQGWCETSVSWADDPSCSVWAAEI